jgi:hypothetical protein
VMGQIRNDETTDARHERVPGPGARRMAVYGDICKCHRNASVTVMP